MKIKTQKNGNNVQGLEIQPTTTEKVLSKFIKMGERNDSNLLQSLGEYNFKEKPIVQQPVLYPDFKSTVINQLKNDTQKSNYNSNPNWRRNNQLTIDFSPSYIPKTY